MHEHVTLVGPEATPDDTPRLSALIGCALGPAIFAIGWTVAPLGGIPIRFDARHRTEDCAREWWVTHVPTQPSRTAALP